MPDIEFNKDNGLWWPTFEKRQQAHYDYHTKHLPDLDYTIRTCNQRMCCIQAGGNVGIWPLKLAQFYDIVHTFEPDPDIYACMEKNCADKNIICYNNGLADTDRELNFYRTGKSGTGYTEINEKENIAPVAKVKAVTIDSLHLDPDAIFLDVEGFEVQVLKGAVETIRIHRPIIQVELLQRTKDEIDSFLESIGYHAVKHFGKDGVYVPR